MSLLQLKDSHLHFKAPLVAQAFADDEQVNLVFYPDRRVLLVAGKSKLFFEKLHKTHWRMLKARNLVGDKSVDVREILIDEDLDDTDRPLDYEVKTTGIINIKF
ncbi:MAG: hypothetical protein MUC97_08215 [Bernardetiaceae bacterium]|jgi:hypothetical protein|nr:hypothetical protein [Bernardetiaceae bacterium]